jgi:hypothetical protein
MIGALASWTIGKVNQYWRGEFHQIALNVDLE